MASVAMTYCVSVFFYFLHKTKSCEIFHHFFSYRKTVFTNVLLWNWTVHVPRFIHYSNWLEIMPFSHLKIIGVVCRSDLDRSCSELHINEIIGYYRDLSIDKRKHDCFSMFPCVARILRVNCHSSITQHCFRTGCCNCNKA